MKGHTTTLDEVAFGRMEHADCQCISVIGQRHQTPGATSNGLVGNDSSTRQSPVGPLIIVDCGTTLPSVHAGSTNDHAGAIGLLYRLWQHSNFKRQLWRVLEGGIWACCLWCP